MIARLAALLTVVLSLFAATPALGLDGSQVGVRPADPAESWVRTQVPPGGSSRGEAVVINLSDETQPVRISAADAITTDAGAFTLAADTATPSGVGAWTVPDVTALTLAPGERRLVGFTLRVPEGVLPGDYAGGLIVQSDRPARRVGGEGVAITVVERVGMRIYQRVPGALDGTVRVEDLSVRRLGGIRSTMGMPSGLEVRFGARSAGNLRYERLIGRIELLEDGGPLAVRAVDLGTLLPGGTRGVALRLPLSGVGGDYLVRVRIDSSPAVTAETSVSVAPVGLYGAGGLAALGVIGLAGWLRRGRRRAERR